MNLISEYYVREADNTADLESDVNGKLKEGFLIHGPPAFIALPFFGGDGLQKGTNAKFIQAMVKPV